MRCLLIIFAVTVAWFQMAERSWAQGSASEEGYLYLSPVPNASYVSDQTRYILVRFAGVSPAQVTNLTTSFITVIGASSGEHTGTARVATDGRTVIFEVESYFVLSEMVTVALNPMVEPGASGSVGPYQYQFRIEGPMPGSEPLGVLAVQAPARANALLPEPKPIRLISAKAPAGRLFPKAIVKSNGVSVPGDFPQVVISVNGNPSPGYLFLENALDLVPPYTMILDNNGLPVWYRRGRMYDFKIQKNGMITWCLDNGIGFPGFDQNLNYLKTFVTTNGYATDGHDLKVLPDGSYFMIGYQNSMVDMSQYVQGASPYATVTETIVQEFTAADELIFQWRAWDNYDIRDLQPTGNTDFAHINGVDIDDDGNLLVSARHLSEVTKVDIDSGQIIWRLSGVHSSFTFINDTLDGTSYQHNISALGGGHYMVFDNGDMRGPQVSRAVEYQIDLTNMTAALVWEFRDNPKAIEVDSNGVKQFELSLVPGSESYRAFRFPWNGVVAAPYLVLEPQPDNLTLIFNKFGDTNVTYYRIYGGLSPHPTNLVAESSTTLQRLSNLQNGLYYFRVTAVNSAGVESLFSNEESTNVNIVRPGQNIAMDGQFSQGIGPWIFTARGGAAAGWVIESGATHFYITNAGPSLTSVQLLQENIPVVQSNLYVLEFDAWSTQTRYIDVKVAQSYPPYLDYSQITAPFLTPNHTHYRYVFTMQQPSDFSANLLFNLGTSTADVYLANITLFTPPAGDFNLDGRVDFLDLSSFCGKWLKQPPSSPVDLNGDGIVNFGDLNILGENWANGGP